MPYLNLHFRPQLAALVTCSVQAERQQAFIDHIAHFLETDNCPSERLSILFLPIPSLQPSARELEVLKLVAEGYSNPEIAESLNLSRNTIKTHVRSLMNKFGVDRRVQLVAIALALDSLENTHSVLNQAS